MPSRAYTSFLPGFDRRLPGYQKVRCQCPLGLIPHFYIQNTSNLNYAGRSGVNALSGLYLISTSKLKSLSAYFSSVNALSGLYLISTDMEVVNSYITSKLGVNALSGLYLISTSYTAAHQKSIIPVSMPSRAYTSFLRYPFKNLGFMRFPEPVFAGIYQNILTTAVFRAC